MFFEKNICQRVYAFRCQGRMFKNSFHAAVIWEGNYPPAGLSVPDGFIIAKQIILFVRCPVNEAVWSCEDTMPEDRQYRNG